MRLPTPWSGAPGEFDGSAPAVELEDLTVDLGETRALDGVSVSLGNGEFVGLVGPNGAGKTTLLRAVTGAVAPTAGQVRVHGEDVAGLASRAASRRVAAVPQNPSLAFAFDVREVVRMGRTPYRSRLGGRSPDREAVERALARTDTDRFADRPINEVSGGERRRVLLARALAQDTPVLLLDEPTASLDINHQINTLELVAGLAREGKTVVAAIHDLNLAARYCDQLVVLADGRLVAVGTPEEVLTETNIETAFGTRGAVTRHPVTGSTFVTALPAATEEHDHRVHVVAGGGSAASLLYALSSAGFEVSVGALNRGDADLEAARALGAEAVTVPPATPVEDDAAAAVRECVSDADVAVVADVAVSEGNLPNLRAVRGADAVVVVESRPFEERNAAGEEARAVYDDLRDRGFVVGPEDALEAVAALAAGSDTTDAPTPGPVSQ